MPQTTIDSKQILRGNVKALRAAFDTARQCEPEADGDARPAAGAAQVTACLHALNASPAGGNTGKSLPETIETLLGSRNLRLEPAHKIRLFTADKLFIHLFENANLDSALEPVVRQLHLPFAAAALADDTVLCHKDNVMRRLLDDIFSQGATWYPHPGKIGRAFPDILDTTVAAIAALNPWDPQQATQYQQAFFNHIASDIRRAKGVEARTCETEMGITKIARAQAAVVEEINASLGASRLPASVADFTLTIWKAELQFVLINEGPEAELWKRWKSILKTLARTFRPELEAEERQQLYNDIPATLRLLEKPVTLHTCPKEDYQQFLTALEEALIQALKGAEVECVTVSPLQMSGEYPNVKTIVSKSLTEKAEQIKEGDWFLFASAEDETLRCKLALKMQGTDQLLFVNRNGHKVMQKSIEEFVLCLSSNIARPLAVAPPFGAALAQALEDLGKRIDSNLTRTRLKMETQARIKARLERQKQQQLEAEAQVRKAAAAKARQEAEALAREKARREEERRAALAAQRRQALLEQQAEEERKRAAAQAIVEELQIGAWMEVPGKDAAPVRCKLAVSIRSSGKYIFVDRLGTKVAEYSCQALVDLLLAKKAKVFARGENFEDQLAKIVRGLRKNIS